MKKEETTKPKPKPKKKKPGPKPKMISLYPFTFDEVVDTLLRKKPKEQMEKGVVEKKEENEKIGE
jgi:hypothetical protein